MHSAVPQGGTTPRRTVAPTRPRVATVPFQHPYLDAVLPTAVDRVGPPPPVSNPWAPSAWLDPDYLRTHADQVDLIHLHFGFDSLTPEQMQAWTTTVGHLGIPLVVTVHDLRNPHHLTRDRHDAHLTALLASAAAVLTLTPSAAREIRQRFGRAATVISHPGLIQPLPGVIRRTGLVGLHLKSLRTNVVDPMGLVAAAARGADVGGGRLRVDVHDTVDLAARLPGLTALAEAGALELAVHPRFDDDELAHYLQTLSVSILPYHFGTHSGWLEACRDVGTRVVAPSCGHYRDQWSDVIGYRNDERRGLVVDSLAGAVRTALHRPAPQPDPAGWRAHQLDDVRSQHALLYAALLVDERTA